MATFDETPEYTPKSSVSKNKMILNDEIEHKFANGSKYFEMEVEGEIYHTEEMEDKLRLELVNFGSINELFLLDPMNALIVDYQDVRLTRSLKVNPKFSEEKIYGGFNATSEASASGIKDAV